MLRQNSDKTFGSDDFGKICRYLRLEIYYLVGWVVAQKGGYLLFTFFVTKRTSAIEQESLRGNNSVDSVKKAFLQGRLFGDVIGSFGVDYLGVAAQSAGGRAWCIKQNDVKLLG